MSETEPYEEPAYESEPDELLDGGELALTEEGIEMPDMLAGYTGEFHMFTPNVDGELETTEAGLPDAEFYDGIFAVMTEEGDWNEWLSGGEIAFETDGEPVTRFVLVDERDE